jgi:hypothetical protein
VGSITRSLQRLWRINTACVAKGVGLWRSTPHACAQEGLTPFTTHTRSYKVHKRAGHRSSTEREAEEEG